MKIAFINTHLGRTGGVNNMVLDMVTIFSAHGHDCTLYYFETHEPEMAFPCKCVKIRMRDQIDFSSYDVVHAHGIRPNAYILWHKPIKKIKTRFIATLHCYVFQDFRDLYGPIKGFFGSFLFLLAPIRFDKLVCLSKDAMKYYRPWFWYKKMTYAYNTRQMDMSMDLNAEELEEVEKFKGNHILIGMNCVLILRKGIDIMLKALEKLPDDYRLIVAGGYPSTQFKALWEEMKARLGERVKFLGMRKDAYRYLKYYDIYVLASRSEGFPLALVEASGYSKKIACTSLKQLKEVFSENDVAYCEPGDVNSLVKAIQKIRLQNDAGKKARHKYEEYLSPEMFYERYLSIYEGRDQLEY